MAGRSKIVSKAGGSASGDACFKCGQPGHWTSGMVLYYLHTDSQFTLDTIECPDNGGAGPSKRAKTTSKSTKPSSNAGSRGRGGKRGGKKGAAKTKGGTFGAPDDF